MASYEYNVRVQVSEALSRRDYQDLVESVEKTITGSGGKWDPEDFSGYVMETTGALGLLSEEDDD